MEEVKIFCRSLDGAMLRANKPADKAIEEFAAELLSAQIERAYAGIIGAGKSPTEPTK